MPQTHVAPATGLVALGPEIGLARGRAHEIAGPARRAMALLLAARMTGAALWLSPAWTGERLAGDGVAEFLDPGRLVFGVACGASQLLWAAEEALRWGATPLVVAELPEPPGLTPVRRLHLAAEAGAARGAGAPLMLLLTPGDGGAPGVETRWRIDPAPGWAADGRPRWRIARLRSRMAPPAAWEMRRTAGRRIEIELLAPERPPSPQARLQAPKVNSP
jgi:protein ImuA